MPIAFSREDGGIYRLTITGMLRKSDLDRSQQQLLAEMDGHDAARLLVILDRFDGWHAGDDWNDLSFYVRHGDAITRIAIVGDERWRGEMLLFAGAGLRAGAVEYFPTGTLADARAWLAA